MFLSVQWRVRSGEIITVGHQIVFTSSYTDLGVCCKIFPQLDFDDPLTRNIILKDYKSLINNLTNINWFNFYCDVSQTNNFSTSSLELRMVRKMVSPFYWMSTPLNIPSIPGLLKVSSLVCHLQERWVERAKYCNKFSQNEIFLQRPVVRQQGRRWWRKDKIVDDISVKVFMWSRGRVHWSRWKYRGQSPQRMPWSISILTREIATLNRSSSRFISTRLYLFNLINYIFFW